ncbi:hypothetical protein WICPIJ_002914 [Wickerhamomyces pijperi]|uniref:BAG domain-containing protein n=1 Tax=Wickerhamomyces pijperi TaxID=599730 RepID=A0A9P8Q897_WICPI|nr:hypothetical protein WICPIJ_002914 [Wickerhamomyces pijperi]
MSQQLIEGVSNTALLAITSLTLLASSYFFYQQLKPRNSAEYVRLDRMLNGIIPLMNSTIEDLESYYNKDTGKYFSDSEKDEDKGFRNKYYQEELLKVLIKIDGVEVVDVKDQEEKASLKARRKELIKTVQSVMKDIEQESFKSLILFIPDDDPEPEPPPPKPGQSLFTVAEVPTVAEPQTPEPLGIGLTLGTMTFFLDAVGKDGNNSSLIFFAGADELALTFDDDEGLDLDLLSRYVNLIGEA